MRELRHIAHVLMFVLMSFGAGAQTEEELKETAAKLFEKEQYVAATSQYLQLLSLNPKDADYNFRYGTCLLFNSFKKQEAIRYLNFAVNEATIDPRAYYFHGKALHLNYQFEDAKASYQKYLNKRSKKDARYPVERAIEMCDNGKKLLSTFTDIVVSEKQEIDSEKFFRLYKNMQTIGGDILVTMDFQSKVDKKKGHIPIVHYPPGAKAIYYASYGDDESSGKDIYIRRRVPGGGWGEPQLLPGEVNTTEDEDFPYMHPSGEHLYFSSKGHNSMGGYDVFRARFNPETNGFVDPENVDFAISSPDDDLFYVVDSMYQNAYFASSRQSQNGKLHVYRVRVARVPLQEVIVMGDFLSEIDPGNKRLSVSVFTQANGKEIGKFVSNEKGKYSFVFPKGGKYEYVAKVDGSEDEYRFVVEIPFLEEFRPLKQNAVHLSVNDQEQVKIVNLFNEQVEGAEALMAEVIRKRAELNVNIDKFDVNVLDAQQERNKILAQLGFKDMSLAEVSNQLEELAMVESQTTEQLNQLEGNLNLEMMEKGERLSLLNEELDALMTKVGTAADPSTKHQLLIQAERKENEIAQLAKEIQSLEQLKIKALEMANSKTASGIGSVELLENKFNALLAANKEEEALHLLVKNKEMVLNTSRSTPDQFVQELIIQSVSLNGEIAKDKARVTEYLSTADVLQSQIIMLQNQLPDAKKKDYERMKQEIAQKTDELKLVKETSRDVEKRIVSENIELAVLDNNISSLKKAMLKTTPVVTTTAQVEDALRESKAALSEIEASTIEQELAQLVETYPELLTNSGDSQVSVEESVTYDEIVAEFEAEKEQWRSRDFATERERIEAELQTVDETLNAIEIRKSKLEKLSESEANRAEIQDEKVRLERFFTEMKEKMASLEKERDKLALESSPSALTMEDLLKEVAPDYLQRQSSIQTTSTINDLEKNKRLLSLNTELVEAIDAELNELEAKIEENPEDGESLARKELIQELRDQKVQEINNLEEWIASNAQKFESNPQEVAQKMEEDWRVKYTDEKEKIATSDLPAFEKSMALWEMEADQLKALQMEQKELIESIENTPENDELMARKSVIDRLINEQQVRVGQQKLQVAQQITPSYTKELIQSIDPTYLEDISLLSNDPESRVKTPEREQELQRNLQSAIAQLASEIEVEYAVKKELNQSLMQQLLEESKARETAFVNETNLDPVTSEEAQKMFITTLRQTTFGGDANSLDATYVNLPELQAQAQTLAFYEDVLTEKIDEVSKQLASDLGNEELKKQQSWLLEEREEVKKKRRSIQVTVGELEAELANNDSRAEEPIVENLTREAQIMEWRKEGLNNAVSVMEEERNSLESLREQSTILSQYQSRLEDQIAVLEEKISEEDKDQAQLKVELGWLEEEKQLVITKQRRIDVQIGELEQMVTVEKQTPEKEDQELAKLKQRETELNESLANPLLSSAERRSIEKELGEVQEKQWMHKNEVYTEALEEGQRENEVIVSEMKTVVDAQPGNERIQKAEILNEGMSTEVKTLMEQAEKAKTAEERNYFLEQARETQTRVNDLLKNTIQDEKRLGIEEKESVVLLSREELEARQRSFTVRVGELSAAIVQTESEIQTARKKEVPALELKRKQFEAERALVESQLHEVEERLLSMKRRIPVVKAGALETELSFNEERKVSSSESYESYYNLATEALEMEMQMINLETELREEQQVIRRMLEQPSSAKTDEEISLRVQRVSKLQSEIDRLNIALVQQKYVADQALPNNEEEAMKMQNLVARGIQPMKKTAVAVALLQLPVSGLAINEEASSPYSVSNPIPIDVESPSGLVYRVQVGAFARPIPQDLFSEFNPVSGEKISGTNITRYMAGFFNNSSLVVDAREKIRALGYNDAFVVAYCDGERIPFGEARKLEQEGLCVPKGANEMMVEVATKTAEKMGISLTDEVQELPEYVYNQAPGAAEADPIELKQGLFFTVQIGVFNRPVGPEFTYGMQELLTIRLPNGQIRYATGMFDSVEEALPRRREALEKGVKGAFVTAYYKGERITLAEAKRLLAEQGKAILQSEQEKEESIELEVPSTPVVRTDTVSSENTTPIAETRATQRIQIVSKKTFEEFPRDVLNRYNAEGTFFYDAADGKVKSIVYTHEDDLPRLWNFREDIDTVYLSELEEVYEEKNVLEVEVQDSILPGDLMDWLLRLNYHREFLRTAEGRVLRIYGVRDENVEAIRQNFRKFGREMEVVKESELETIEE